MKVVDYNLLLIVQRLLYDQFLENTEIQVVFKL